MTNDSTPPGPATDERGEPHFPIVGVGASAGGLEALTALVKALKIDHMAVVIVQHMSPQHESMLPELLGRVSRMTVVGMVDGMRIESNHVYVAPGNTQVSLTSGVLHVIAPEARHPIDFFFRSLAEDHDRDAIGVVLSGMGSDGTLGLRAIREHGGITFVQSPETARYDSMPRSAIDGMVADRVLAPDAIGQELMEISGHPYLNRKLAEAPSTADGLHQVLVLLRSAFGNDLSSYKKNTIERRLERRMAVRKVARLEDYVPLLKTDPEELAILYRDILINVTSFFRDAEAFDALRSVVLPKIVDRKRGDDTIRIWVPACATGEEAYSIAICLLETLGTRASNFRVQIFATDIDTEAIAHARRAVYPTNIELDVSPERLERFFIKLDNHYQVHRRVRDSLVFSTQNLATDAPFSKLDLVSCRNLLIYFQPVLQKKVLRILHYALNPDAALMLGTSETIGDASNLFALADRKNKIYAKKNLPLAPPLDLGGQAGSDPHRPYAASERRAVVNVQHLADRKILERYAPPSVLVSESLDVIQFRGHMGPYLAPTPGTATLNLMRLVRPELHVELWRILQQVQADRLPARIAPIRIESSGAEPPRHVAVEILPIEDPESRARCLLVLFRDASPPVAVEPSAVELHRSGESANDERARELEQELTVTREYLQTTVEELQSSNEELKSTNEELQSSNEELQSTNEELETSKEEMQATNEELRTVNDELRHRLGDLSQSNNDLNNVLRAVREPVVLVDGDGRIGRFTEGAGGLLNLLQTDIGRPIEHIRPRLPGVDLERLIAKVRERAMPLTDEVRAADGRWYALHVLPYTTEGAITGALLALEDIDTRKRSNVLEIDVAQYAAQVLSAVPHPLAIVDRNLRVMWVNAPFLELFGVSAKDTIGNLFPNLGSGQWAHPKLRGSIEATLDNGSTFRDFRIEHDFEGIGRQVMGVSGSRILGLGHEERVVLLSIEAAVHREGR
jgi:two-component system CheB/CheR fusion protein